MSDRERSSGDAGADAEDVGEIVNPEDLPTRIEVSEHDGVTRIDIADDADIRPGEVDEA
ncbi:multidrug transporter [Agromyces ramosus]|nr:multidrug transporter [Agromyces ramosus]